MIREVIQLFCNLVNGVLRPSALSGMTEVQKARVCGWSKEDSDVVYLPSCGRQIRYLSLRRHIWLFLITVLEICYMSNDFIVSPHWKMACCVNFMKCISYPQMEFIVIFLFSILKWQWNVMFLLNYRWYFSSVKTSYRHR